ncbi:MAG: chromosome segregation protein SMC, partial [Thermus sp.]
MPDPRPRLRALEEEKERLEAILAQALAYERHREAERHHQEYLLLKAEAERVRQRLSEIAHSLEALRPLEEGLKEKERRLRGLDARLKEISEAETTLLLRRNQLASERENLRVALARKEAALEGVLAELSLLPEGEALEGTSRQLAQELARLEVTLAQMGPVNPLAEREEEELARTLESEEMGIQEVQI